LEIKCRWYNNQNLCVFVNVIYENKRNAFASFSIMRNWFQFIWDVFCFILIQYSCSHPQLCYYGEWWRENEDKVVVEAFDMFINLFVFWSEFREPQSISFMCDLCTCCSVRFNKSIFFAAHLHVYFQTIGYCVVAGEENVMRIA
jgi:hypothetical protein